MNSETKSFAHVTPSVRRLSDENRQRIHEASLEILQRTGARLFDQEAIDLLKKAGAQISEGNLVRISPNLVERALTTAPKMVTLYSRGGGPVMPIGGRNVFFGNGSDCANVFDLDSGEKRKATLEDCSNGIRLCDALPNLDFVMSFCFPSDMEQDIYERHQMRYMLSNSTKPIIFVSTNFETCVDAIEMAQAVAGGEKALQQSPLCACYINVTGPLRHNEESLQKLLWLAGRGLPSVYTPVVFRGMTGPVTLPGAVALGNAGDLVGVVLSQLKREGAPIIVSGGMQNLTDMQTMVMPYGAPENRSMYMEMGRHYDLPIWGIGGVTDSKVPDEQAAAEAALSMLAEALSGANLLHDIGYMESGLTVSFEMLAIYDELAGWVKRFLEVPEVNEDTLALDLINEVGPDGSYLDKDHTYRHFREDWYPRLIDRQSFEGWVAAGGKTLRQRAGDTVRQILEEHQPEPLPTETVAALDAIVERAEAALS